MTIHHVALVALFALLRTRTVSTSDCQWHNAIEFWSNVVCSMEDIKTVNFHDVLESGRSSIVLERCFQAFVYDIARKCETTIVSRIHALDDAENLASFVSNNDIAHIAHRFAKRASSASIWQVTSNDALPSRVRPSAAAGKIRIRSDKTFDGNTWNVHVILAKDIHSFDQIARGDTTFEWNSHDRFIVLITRFPEEQGPSSNESNSRIGNILKTLWSKRKVQKIFVSEATLVNDTVRINRIVRTYNPFVKVNDSVWGKVERTSVKTAEEASSVLSHLIYRRTKNMNGYELKVGYFKQGHTLAEPTKVQSNTHYADYVFKGFDEIVLNTIARDMNFKVEHIHPTDNKSYGYQLPNGTYVGAIVHGRTDVCFASFFVKKYSTNPKEDVDFTACVDFDGLCVVVPKATKIPKGIRIYHFFPLSVWICSMLAHVFTYLIWYFLQVFTPGRTGKKSFRATIYRSFLLTAGCPQKLPNTNAERILLSGILLANVTLVGIFSGILYNSFAHDMYYPDIDNLHDLDASGLPISLTSASLADLFDDDDDDDDVDSTSLMQSLRKKMQFGTNSISNAAHYRNVSAFARKSYFPIITEELIDTDGGPLLHLVEECPGKFYLSYLLPKNSILNEKINALISQLNQAGLPSLWSQHIVHTFIVQKWSLAKEKLTRNGNGMDGFVPFNLSDVQSSFYMLLIGLSISTIVFLCEKGWLKVPLLHTKKPNDKCTR
ncbi:uncharacterized protein LOC112453325 isoform X2 [Temnothorax curvispinosus]|uniref:Uncharacterized protein LOC112453325 isoform X2 n=1 Tax=Temnothorax curvispinosus TaxID=300111 RepID=A0A6J1PKD0_9HYME|nr:uncharacterized protein LOC112453325 isoform X2 [Temnothorax curvispinosus]